MSHEELGWGSQLTRRKRQLLMQNWACARCGGRHAYWWHTTPPPSHSTKEVPAK